MPIQKIVPKSAVSLRPTRWVANINDFKIQYAIEDLLATLADFQEKNGGIGGVGLAANQIEYPAWRYGEDFVPPNIYVVSVTEKRAAKERAAGTPCVMIPPSVYINASMTPVPGSDGKISEGERYQEACLSVMGFCGQVPRYQEIEVKALNEKGEKITKTVSGFEARIHQHELDHGKGLEYLNQLKFSVEELQRILDWIETIKTAGGVVAGDLPMSIIPGKLDCNSRTPMLGALKVWTEDALAKPAFSSLCVGPILPWGSQKKSSSPVVSDRFFDPASPCLIFPISHVHRLVPTALPRVKNADAVKPAGNALLWAAAGVAGVACVGAASVLLRRRPSMGPIKYLKDQWSSSGGPKF